MKSVDVVVLTKNSDITIDLTLKGIVNAIPVNNLIVVDGYSTDNTVSIAKKYGAKILYEKGKLAKARYRGVQQVETDWFCFVDSDILLFPFWFERLVKWTEKPRMAWVQGKTFEHSIFLKSYATFKSGRRGDIGFQKPAALSNSLLRKEVVLACTEWLREDIHAGEDSILYDSVNSNRYGIIKDLSFFACLHLPDCFLHDVYAYYRGGFSQRLKDRNKTQVRYLGYPFFLLRKAVIGFFNTMDPRLFAYYPFMQGMAFLVKYLRLAGDRSDAFMRKLEKRSEVLGVDAFLSHPVDPEGNSLAQFVQ